MNRIEASVARSTKSVRVARIVVALAIVASAAPAIADPPDTTWLVQVGDGDRAVKSVTVGLTRALYPFGLTDASAWSIYGEVLASEWFVNRARDGDRSHFTQFGFTPVLRYTFAAGVFVEAGIGLDVITPRFRDNDRTFSTKFNFADHLAAGVRFGQARANEISLRVEHFSNGGIRNPNPGQNFVEVRYARHF